MNHTLHVIVMTSLCCIILLFIILCVCFLQKTPLSYYPAIQLSSYEFSSSSSSNELQPCNNGIASATIQSSSLYPVPFGFSFLSDWTFDRLQQGGDVILDHTDTCATVDDLSGWGIVVGSKPLQGNVMYSVAMTYPGYQTDANGIGIVGGLFSPHLSYAHNSSIGSKQKGVAVYDTGNVLYETTPTFLLSGDSFQNRNGLNIVDIAVSTTSGLWWYRVDGEHWNGTIESNPVTGRGGWSINDITN